MANELSNEHVDPETGEVTATLESNQPLAIALAQAELNQAVTTARAFPRSITKAVQAIITLATLDEETAKECVYALPRGGKPIVGPSVRFAEIVASQWGNCHVGSRVVDIDRFNKAIIAEGVFHDLETGLRVTKQITRRAVDRNGRLFNDDMLMVTSNAASSIAYREAVLKGIPKAVWRRAYEATLKVKAGDAKTLAVRRSDMLAAFAVWGVKPEQIFSALEIGGLDDIDLERMALLGAMHKQIKDGEQTVEEFFPAKASEADRTAAAKGTASKLADIAKGGQPGAAEAAPAAAEATPKTEAQPAAEASPKADEAKAAGKDKEAAVKAETSKAEASPKAVPASAAAPATGDDDLLGGDAAPVFGDEDLEVAFKRGAAAREKGMARKATPTEWRDAAHATLLDAYLRGFDGE